MKRYVFTTVSLLLLSCSSSDKKAEEIIINKTDIVQKTVGVDGMTCVGCEVTLEDNISKILGVVNVRASSSSNNAIIEFDSTKTNVMEITKSIKDAGYKPFLIEK